MQITWYGHSCFKVETDAGSAVFDPYEDGRVPGYAPLPRNLSADAVICSHQHGDHNAVERVKLSGNAPGFSVETLATYHDEVKGKKRGENTIHIISAEGMRLAHMGDIGCELTPNQLVALQKVDVLLIPIGGFYTIDAVQAKTMADAIGARITIPMHYRNGNLGYDVIGTRDDFIARCDGVVNYDSNRIEVTAKTAKQTAVFTYLPQ